MKKSEEDKKEEIFKCVNCGYTLPKEYSYSRCPECNLNPREEFKSELSPFIDKILTGISKGDEEIIKKLERRKEISEIQSLFNNKVEEIFEDYRKDNNFDALKERYEKVKQELEGVEGYEKMPKLIKLYEELESIGYRHLSNPKKAKRFLEMLLG